MKCCAKYDARQLSAKVTIERKTQSADGMGGYTEAWAADPAGGTWAMWKPLRGSERYQSMRLGPELRVLCVIRHRADGNGAPYYTAADRVTYQGRTYAIEAVIDVEDRFLELHLIEGRKS